MIYKIRFFCFLLIVLAVLVGCSTPSPLNGKWADGNGSMMVLNPDMSFQFSLKGVTEVVNYEGSYSVSNNALVFVFSDRSQSVVTEWDMRGSIMIIEWPNSEDTSGKPFNILKLYKVG